MKVHDHYIDLAPTIIRRRLVIEGISEETFTEESMKTYMIQLSEIMDMTIVSDPIFNYDEKYGLSSYMCWKESGMHIYTWKKIVIDLIFLVSIFIHVKNLIVMM